METDFLTPASASWLTWMVTDTLKDNVSTGIFVISTKLKVPSILHSPNVDTVFTQTLQEIMKCVTLYFTLQHLKIFIASICLDSIRHENIFHAFLKNIFLHNERKIFWNDELRRNCSEMFSWSCRVLDDLSCVLWGMPTLAATYLSDVNFPA